MSGPLRVLMLVPNLRVSNGVAAYAMNYFRLLDREQVHMDFALYADIPSPYHREIEAAGSRIWLLPPMKRLGEHLAACRQMLEEGRYDIVHDNSLHITLPTMLLARRRVAVRILHSHGSKLGADRIKAARNRLFLPLLRSLATDYAACSGPAGRLLFGERPYTFIPNIISAERCRYDPLRREQLRREMGATDKLVLVTVGRANAFKNPLFAMEVFKLVSERLPQAEYWWIGSGDMDRDLAACVERLGLSDRVRLLGSREDVIDLYQAADLFLLPSLSEGMPLSVLEAQALGLPCLLSDAIPPEVVFTELPVFFPLSAGAEAWADRLAQMAGSLPPRAGRTEALLASIFSDASAGETLARYYRTLIER